MSIDEYIYKEPREEKPRFCSFGHSFVESGSEIERSEVKDDTETIREPVESYNDDGTFSHTVCRGEYRCVRYREVYRRTNFKCSRCPATDLKYDYLRRESA